MSSVGKMVDCAPPQVERAAAEPAAIDRVRLERGLATWRSAFESGEPFPHVVIDDFLSPDAADEAYADFPKPDDGHWTHYKHLTERKIGRSHLASFPLVHRRIVEELSSEFFLGFLERLTGAAHLLADPSLEGGGLHQSERGGFVWVHSDFRSHPTRPDWQRRVNLLIYLNPDWRDEYGGGLEFWDRTVSRCVTRVQPVFNRCVVFLTDERTFHGHPEPLVCPPSTTRKSVALYYYTTEAQPTVRSATKYRALPTDTLLRKGLIAADNALLSGYAFSKRRLGFRDEWASRLLRALWR